MRDNMKKNNKKVKLFRIERMLIKFCTILYQKYSKETVKKWKIRSFTVSSLARRCFSAIIRKNVNYLI